MTSKTFIIKRALGGNPVKDKKAMSPPQRPEPKGIVIWIREVYTKKKEKELKKE
jgi:hypothetical protein